MTKPLRTLFTYGPLLVLAGSLSAAAGLGRLLRFWDSSDAMGDLPVKQQVGLLARGMIVPHVFTFVGLGLAVFGLILIIRGLIFRWQQKRSED